MVRSLEGQTILITGAAIRIGRSLAITAAQQGANIVIHYGKSRMDAEMTLSEVEKLGVKGLLIQADLNDSEQVRAIIPNALEFGPIDTVVNSASIFEPLQWSDTSLSDWNRHMNINLTAPFLISQGFAQTLSPDRPGRIINILDWRAERPGSDHFPYSISKAGLTALTKSLAQALAPRITVNAMALGAILPPSDGNVRDDLLYDVPIDRWGTLEEVNQTLLFLLTGPTYITGEILHLDGGRHLV